MPPRIQVQDLYKDRGYAPAINPMASPVDTFVSPNKITNPNAKVLELVDAFQDIQPGLRKFTMERATAYNEGEMEKGRAAALANKADFKKAIDEGLIPAGNTPWFRVGWERQKARVAGEDYDLGLREAYAKSGISESDDPSAFRGFVADYTSSWQAGNPQHANNPEFASVFGRVAQNAQSNLANAHAGVRSQKIEADVVQNTELELDSVLNSDEETLISQGGFTKGQSLANVVNAQVANGLSGQVANKLVAQTVIRRAEETGDLLLLDVLNDVPSGSGTVGQIGWVKDRVSQARDRIAQEQFRNDRLGNARDDEAKKGSIQRLQSAVNTKLFDDLYGSDITQELRELNAIDPAEAIQAAGWRATLVAAGAAQQRIVEDPLAKTDFNIRAVQGDLSYEEVRQAVADRLIDADTAKSLITDLIPTAKKHKGVLKDDVFNTVLKMQTDEITKNNFAFEDAHILRGKANEASFALMNAMIRYTRDNPNASEHEKLKYLYDHSNLLKQVYGQAPELMNKGGKATIDPQPKPVDLDSSDPSKDILFPDVDALRAAVMEYEQTGEGRFKALSILYGMDVEALYAAQASLLKNKTKK